MLTSNRYGRVDILVSVCMYLLALSLTLDLYDFDIFVGGHLIRSGTRQDVQIHHALTMEE